MNNNDIYSIDFTRSLPPALKNDPKMITLAQTVAEQLQVNSRLINRNIIYSRIDELDEETLDVLAHDLHVDWYDCSWPINIKKKIIRDNVKVHRYMGTPYAVKTAVGAVFSNSQIKEWFEYGGNPYYFKILLYDQDMPVSIPAKEIRKAVEFYKSLRSHLEKITMIIEAAARLEIGFSWRLAMRTRLSVWGMHEIRLNGSRGLNGEWILSSVWDRGAHFEKFDLHHRKRMPLQMTVYMTIMQRAGFEQQDIPKLSRFAVRTRNNVYSPQTMMLDGSHRLDGGGRLGIVFMRGGALRACAFRASANASPCIKAGLIRNNMWRLDGSRSLDGEQLLNADIITSDL